MDRLGLSRMAGDPPRVLDHGCHLVCMLRTASAALRALLPSAAAPLQLPAPAAPGPDDDSRDCLEASRPT